VLTLSYIDGKPHIRTAGNPRRGGGGITKLSPHMPTETLEEANASVSIRAIQQFITRPYVFSKKQLENALYLIGVRDDCLIYGSGDRVYARGLVPLMAGGRYSVFRSSEILIYLLPVSYSDKRRSWCSMLWRSRPVILNRAARTQRARGAFRRLLAAAQRRAQSRLVAACARL
jgi:hypothetical protein